MGNTETAIRTAPSAEATFLEKAVIGLLLFACQATNIKVAEIQLFEWLCLAFTPYFLYRSRGRFSVAPALTLVPFLVVAFYASLWSAIALDFFPPGSISPLKKPLVISLIRISQLVLVYLFVNFLFERLADREAVLRTIRSYVKTSVWIAGLSILAYLVALGAGVALPFVYDTAPYLRSAETGFGTLRVRGLFFEGGPYGLSLVATFALMLLGRRLGLRWGWLVWGTLIAAFVLAQSKAGILALFLMGALFLAHNMDFRKLAVAALVLIVAAFSLFQSDSRLSRGLDGYVETFQLISSAEFIPEAGDDNRGSGRMAAFFIGPRMFLGNPWLGVGMGNYSLSRNNPEYLGPMPATQSWDLPGLGLFTILLENGVLGFLTLMAGYLALFLWVRGRVPPGPGRSLIFLFWVPLVVQAMGVQIYFAYHWIVLSLWAMALTSGAGEAEGGDPLPGPVSGQAVRAVS